MCRMTALAKHEAREVTAHISSKAMQNSTRELAWRHHGATLRIPAVSTLAAAARLGKAAFSANGSTCASLL
jgi:hypothetical protein